MPRPGRAKPSASDASKDFMASGEEDGNQPSAISAASATFFGLGAEDDRISGAGVHDR